MRLIQTESIDVYFNLAAEAYLLEHSYEDILILWRSDSAVVCGKHQNICAEINYAHCIKNGIHPARRISGGGTVYHDMGNVNFTFIQNLKTGLEKAIDYKQFLEPIRSALKAMGVETQYSHRNDLLCGDEKISGNAQHLYQQKRRILHHGTLLFDANIQQLGDTLHPQGNYQDKAVKSYRSKVTNLSAYFNKFKDVEAQLAELWRLLAEQFSSTVGHLSEIERKAIMGLRNQKFALPEWILGYSPNYQVDKVIDLKFGTIKWHAKFEKAVVKEAIFMDSNGIAVLTEVSSRMIGLFYYSPEFRDALKGSILDADDIYLQLF